MSIYSERNLLRIRGRLRLEMIVLDWSSIWNEHKCLAWAWSRGLKCCRGAVFRRS